MPEPANSTTRDAQLSPTFGCIANFADIYGDVSCQQQQLVLGRGVFLSLLPN